MQFEEIIQIFFSLQTVMAIGLVLSSDTYTMIDFFSFVAWMFYGGAFLSLIVLRFTGAKLERPFRVRDFKIRHICSINRALVWLLLTEVLIPKRTTNNGLFFYC